MEKSQFLCSRLCHDLLGPVGALGMGMDLLESDPGSGEIISLLHSNQQALRTKLEFFRAAFGGGVSSLSGEKARDLVEAYYQLTKSQILWPEKEISEDPSFWRFFLQVSLIPLDCLPRGGRVLVSFVANKSKNEFFFKMEGVGSAVPSFLETFLLERKNSPLTPRTIFYSFAFDLADFLGYKIVLSPSSPQELCLSVVFL